MILTFCRLLFRYNSIRDDIECQNQRGVKEEPTYHSPDFGGPFAGAVLGSMICRSQGKISSMTLYKQG